MNNGEKSNLFPATVLEQLRTEITTSHKPLYFFDDDPDGVAAFLYLYGYKKDGRGILVKARPELNEFFAKIVTNHQPDRIIILDIALMNDYFREKIRTPISWIDHHDPQEKLPKNISYYNPKKYAPDSYIPTSQVAYEALHAEEGMHELSWVAAAGCIGDYVLPSFLTELNEQFPDLLRGHHDLDMIRYHSPLGTITRMFSFLTMGATADANNNMKILTRVTDPRELTEGTTSRGRFLIKQFKKIDKQYQQILDEALATPIKDKVLFFKYAENKISVTTELANELSILNKKCLIIVARERNGECKMSLRYTNELRAALEKALEHVDGHGGGHAMACGASVKSSDIERFLEILKDELGLGKK